MTGEFLVNYLRSDSVLSFFYHYSCNVVVKYALITSFQMIVMIILDLCALILTCLSHMVIMEMSPAHYFSDLLQRKPHWILRSARTLVLNLMENQYFHPSYNEYTPIMPIITTHKFSTGAAQDGVATPDVLVS